MLADLARAAGLSKQYLRKICRTLGLAAPLAQLYQQRLHRASDLLLHTGLSIKEIADQCGFENPYHFSRKFKQWSSLLPARLPSKILIFRAIPTCPKAARMRSTRRKFRKKKRFFVFLPEF